MKSLVIVMLALCGGCGAVAGGLAQGAFSGLRFKPDPPKTIIVNTKIELSELDPEPAGALVVTMEGRAETIAVRATRQRECEQNRFQGYDRYTYSGSHSEPTIHGRVWLGTVHTHCPLALAKERVTLALPSGAVLEATTAMDGTAHFTIPDSEPPSGTVVAHVADRGLPLRYHVSHEACVEDRRALFTAAAASEPKGRAGRLAALPPNRCDDDDDAAWALVTTAAIEAARSTCSTTRAIDQQLFAHYPVLHDAVFVAEHDIAWCLHTAPPG